MTEYYEFFTLVNERVWLIPLIMIICIGIYSTFKFKGIQFTKIPEMISVTFSNKGKKSKASAFRIFCISMASRIGVGNVTGPIVAIMIGGPGAIFWMWVFAIIGSATGFVEAVLGQIYKKKGDDGFYRGGPAYNYRYGLNRRKMAIGMALLLVVLNFIGFVAIQASAMSMSISNAIDVPGGSITIAVILSVVVFLIIVGGFKRISDVSAFMIPFMAVGWVVICAIAIINNGNIIGAFNLIFSNAFSIPSAIGGTFGAMLSISMMKSVFSNEAGLGKSTCVSSSADVKHPVYQGYTQAFGVLVDMIVFTFSALAVLSFTGFNPLEKTDMSSIEILHLSFSSVFGAFAPFIITVFVFVFALSTIYGDFFIGLTNVEFLSSEKKWKYLSYAVTVVVVFFAACVADDKLFIVSDFIMAFVAVFNCIAVILLFKKVIAVHEDYRKQVGNGAEEAEFHSSSIDGDQGITEWD